MTSPSIPAQLTTVVNYWPEIDFPIDTVDDSERYIGKEAIYKLAEIQALAKLSIYQATRRCRRDVENLDWDDDDIIRAIQSLKSDKHFLKAVWCRTSPGTWVRCDSFLLRKYDDGILEDPILVDIYLKFGLSETGETVLIISCHV